MLHVQSTFVIDAQIRHIAATQLGVITVDQARQCGVGRNALARHRASGALIAIFREAMGLAPFATTPTQRVLAASLVVPGSVIAATSAAVVHQMPVPTGRATTDDVVLSVAASRLVRIPGITTVRQTTPLPSTQWLTTRVATPAATLLLLPRFVDEGTVERCLDHALAHRMCTVTNVRRLLERTPYQAVYKRQFLLDLLADRSNGMGHRNAKEQQVARWLTSARLMAWTRNLRVRVRNDQESIEVDFGWRSVRLALEVRPFFIHGSREKQERYAERRRLLVANDWRVVEALDHDIATERAFARTTALLRALGAGLA